MLVSSYDPGPTLDSDDAVEDESDEFSALLELAF